MHTPTSQPLFIRHKSAAELLEKQAAAVARMPDDDKRWPAQVLSEMHKQLPFLSRYDVDIELTRVEPEAGYALGYAMLRNKTGKERAAEELGKATNKLRVPVIVADRLLQPFHVFEVGGKTYPLTQERVESAMMNPSMFDGVSDPPGTQSLLDQIYPPFQHRQGYGMMSGDRATVGLSKLSSAPAEKNKVDPIGLGLAVGAAVAGAANVARMAQGRDLSPALLSSTLGLAGASALRRHMLQNKTASRELGPLREFLRQQEIEKNANMMGDLAKGGKSLVKGVGTVGAKVVNAVKGVGNNVGTGVTKVRNRLFPPVEPHLGLPIPDADRAIHAQQMMTPPKVDDLARVRLRRNLSEQAPKPEVPVPPPVRQNVPPPAGAEKPQALSTETPAQSPERGSNGARSREIQQDLEYRAHGLMAQAGIPKGTPHYDDLYENVQAHLDAGGEVTPKAIKRAHERLATPPANVNQVEQSAPAAPAPPAYTPADIDAHDYSMAQLGMKGVSPEQYQHYEETAAAASKRLNRTVTPEEIHAHYNQKAPAPPPPSPMEAHAGLRAEYADMPDEAAKAIAQKAGINPEWLAAHAMSQKMTMGDALHSIEGRLLEAQRHNPNITLPDVAAAYQARGGFFGKKYSPTGNAQQGGGGFLGSAPGGLTMLGLGAVGGGLIMANKASENY